MIWAGFSLVCANLRCVLLCFVLSGDVADVNTWRKVCTPGGFARDLQSPKAWGCFGFDLEHRRL